jgi:hypothetical protein
MKKTIILFFVLLSCSSTKKINEIKSETIIENETYKVERPKVELSVSSDIEVQDVELRDFRNFMVWVTTKNLDTIASCKLEKVPSIKGIENLPHFFIKFQTLPIVYKMKVENNELVFAKIKKEGTN